MVYDEDLFDGLENDDEFDEFEDVEFSDEEFDEEEDEYEDGLDFDEDEGFED